MSLFFDRYVPSFLPPPSHGRELEEKDDEKPREKEKGKSRYIDKFLEELKFEQELREKCNQECDERHTDTGVVSTCEKYFSRKCKVNNTLAFFFVVK
ncbi:protein RRC1-like [Zingiber officinale]|uniref:protein RRC1-like n=1 Tax=Zingiber officinale TaxID=94328 RepID=UPI001C4DB9C4|nr:protein RRC1-like [Zingiber officinale]